VVSPTLPSETDNGIIITRTGYIASRKDALMVMWEDAVLREPLLASCR
jgi:type VI secretion system secreted protein VgrG